MEEESKKGLDPQPTSDRVYEVPNYEASGSLKGDRSTQWHIGERGGERREGGKEGKWREGRKKRREGREEEGGKEEERES